MDYLVKREYSGMNTRTMVEITHAEKLRIANQNISYYDEIAHSYDETLSQEHSNKIVRQKVKEKFTSLLKSGWVLDFGGGTGIDLDWLAANYDILFCEPSDQMREKAIQSNINKLNRNTIVFLDKEKTVFSTWHNNLPFSQQVGGILSNFGVINCIPDIEFLFNNLALVIKPAGHLVAVFLDRPLKKMWSWHRRNTIRSLVLGTPFIMYVRHKDHQQTVFVHSIKEVKKASSRCFDYVNHELLSGTGFILIHLVRK